MSINALQTARLGELARTSGASRQIGRTQAMLHDAQQKLLTGRRLNAPSDNPGDAAATQQLRRTLEAREGYEANLQRADRVLGVADGTLNDVVELLREARQIGMSALGDAAGEGERRGAAETLRTIRRQLLTLANTTRGGVAIFGGGTGVEEPYVMAGSGVKYVGGERGRELLVGANGATLDTLVDADTVFGGISRRVGTTDISPAATAATRLDDFDGARGRGVERGAIRLTNAGVSAVVDLSDADTLGDVITRINASGIGVTASLGPGNALQLAGSSVTVGDVTGQAAADLGLLTATPTASVTGADLRPRITPHTPLANLNGGAGIDVAGGLTITNGTATDNFSLAGLNTVGDLLNALNASPAHLNATISDDGSRLLLRNPVQGSELRIAESGGTTAADLGWLTFTANDPIAELNGGRGLRLAAEGTDMRLTDPAGTMFEVELGGAGTVADVVAAINAAAGAAGATTTASFDPAAPGLVLANVDGISSLNGSNAVTDLGLDAAPVAGTIGGRDVNAVTSEGVFGHLEQLITSLEQADSSSATRALSSLEADEAGVIRARGEVGGRMREVSDRLERLADDTVVTRDVLSRLEDVEFSEAVLEYQTLQASLQAQLQTTAQLLNLSLFDFLR